MAIRVIFLSFCLSVSILFAETATEVLKWQVCNTLPSLEGWCSKEKAIHFIDLVLEIKPETCVEIGVFGGSSLFPVASALKFLKKGIVIGIDPWDKVECIKYYSPVKDEMHMRWWLSLNIGYVYQSYIHMLQQYGLENYVKTIQATSKEAVHQIPGIDILHIDGNHSSFCSKQDVELYLPKVKKGGYIWMNDALSEERKSATDLLTESCDIIRTIDGGGCILFKKR